MEKYLRLLNPKTTNYEAIPSGCHGALTTADICISISYAKLSEVQNILLEVYALKKCTVEYLNVISKVIHQKLISCGQSENTDEHGISIYIALVELCLVSADYKPTVRNRGLIGGVSYLKVHRRLGVLIDTYLEIFKEELNTVAAKISKQIGNKNN
ncbi:TPA: hypothetical protein JI092_12030 [Acinetobacter baumannii]|nr:hypothetical protein [Acinetobacter baumannii]